MKTVVFFSSIFFLLGLKLSNIINLPEKVDAVDNIITNKIIQSKPVQAIPLFKDSETEAQEEKGKEKPETTSQPKSEETK